MNHSKIPEGWEDTDFGDNKYFEVIGSGIKLFSGKKDYLSTSSVEEDKVVKVEEIITYKKRPSRANMQPIENSVWFAKMKATLKVLNADSRVIKKNILSTGFCGVLCKNIEPEYLKQVFLTESFNIIKDSKTEGSTQEAINNNSFKKIKIMFPKSIHEQQKITHILLTVDNTIDKTKELIEKNKKIKQGLMSDLFKFGIDENGKPNSKLKASLFGEIPENWITSPIYSSCEVVDYRGRAPPKVESGVFLVTSRNIKNGIINYKLAQEYVPNNKYDSIMKRGFPIKGDVLITTEAPCGEVANVDIERIALAQRIIKLRGKNNLNNYYLKIFLETNTFQSQLAVETTGSTVKGIKGSRLIKMNLLIPKDKKEQERIIKVIHTIEYKIKTENNYLEKLLKIKAGLMQDLLTGKVRVAV